jgi:hypothetical protein
MPPPLSLTENYYKILASEHPKIQIPNILQKWNSFQRFEHKGSIQILDRPHRFSRNVPARPIFLRKPKLLPSTQHPSIRPSLCSGLLGMLRKIILSAEGVSKDDFSQLGGNLS